MKINKTISIQLLFLIFIFFLYNINYLGVISKNNLIDQNNELKPRTAGFWDLTGTPIVIDDFDPSKNWTYTALHYDWCSGSGTFTDPYVIENVTINGKNSSSCITILNSDAYFIIRNCTLYNSSNNDAGIYLYHTNNGKIIDNYCYGNSNGIELYRSNNNIIIGNIANNNTYYGVALSHSSNNNTIIGNTANYNTHGITIPFDCFNNTLSGNKLMLNGFSISGCQEMMTSQKIDTTNLVNGKPFYYYVNKVGLKSSAFFNTGQIYLVNCNDSKIEGVNVSYASFGISLYYSNNNTIFECIANNNEYGITLTESNNNTLLRNVITHNLGGVLFQYSSGENTFSDNEICDADHGIVILSSNNNTFSQNTIRNNKIGIFISFSSNNNTFFENKIQSNNEWGVYISNGPHNLFYKNSFIKNMIHAFDYDNNNFWNNSEIGNYWDNYTGIDSNDDGIGDTPYIFNGGTDNLPIVDNDLPNIKINLPKMNDVFGANPPNFIVEINDLLLDSMWYSLNHGKNITFLSNNTIEQSEWNNLPDGSVTLTFYANDTSGNVAFSEVIIQKDTIEPNFVIVNPIMNEEFGETAPTFRITIEELNLDKVWYTIEGITEKIFINDTIGIINQSIWESIPPGHVTIRF
ncbi:MAG: right-handed parallel beta-helix repeat-containing protein, partial [Promethearchaeota archaeon]